MALCKEHRKRYLERSRSAGITERPFEQQLASFGLTKAQIVGRRIVVYGPGYNFLLEKGLLEAGAELVVAVGDYTAHEEKGYEFPSDIPKQYPNLLLVSAIFAQIPLKKESFHLGLSSWAIPMYSFLHDDTEADVIWEFSQVIDPLMPGGENRFFPASRAEVDGYAGSIHKKYRNRVAITWKRNHPADIDGVMVTMKR